MSQSPRLRETLATVAITRENSQSVFSLVLEENIMDKNYKPTETKLERGTKLIRELDEKAKEQGISGRTMRDVRSRMKNELEYQVNEKQENSIRLKE